MTLIFAVVNGTLSNAFFKAYAYNVKSTSDKTSSLYDNGEEKSAKTLIKWDLLLSIKKIALVLEFLIQLCWVKR